MSREAVKILKKVAPLARGGRIFPGQGNALFISDTSLVKTLKEYRTDVTIHGLRSSFRDWCAESTTYPREVADAALAHSLISSTEAAYQRSDLLEKRVKLMGTSE